MKRKMMAAVMIMVMGAAILSGCGNASDAASGAGTTAEGADLGAEAGAATETDGKDTAANGAAAQGTVYKVGIVQYVDDASLNQIEKAIEEQLDAKGAELGVTFDYSDYKYNGQADSSTLNQIAADLVAEEVDVIIPIATPAAMIMQNATEDNQIPVVFSAVSDPVGAGLVADMSAPGSNITGTSDALDTEAIMKLILAADADAKKIGLLYDKSQDSSKGAIDDAKAYCDANGLTYIEKTGTTNAEVSAAADSLIASGVDAVFTPTDNTIMTAELAIYEKFIEAGIPHYTGADSFALNGAFCGYGVSYTELGTATADMVAEILVHGAKPSETAVQTMDNGIVTVNMETAAGIGIEYSMFAELCSELKEITTAQEFE